ncbi:MAG: ribonuclease E/G, partial [Limnohabitans sp.]
GLMEMSRQRLRPALSEGASIPCPRCGGSGHVRDTESSALQILRIIQEESMKENTAAVHAQVPVEVASFLLNEKRPEIAKIELKQRTHVLLIPNKGLETPNYKLERLKHDDPRLDNLQASYKMAEEIEDPTAVTRRSQEPTNRQTPVIKGVLPDMPAPAAEARPARATEARQATARPTASPAPAPAEKGFFGWLKSLFGGDTAPAAPAADTARGTPKPPERSDSRSPGRGSQDGRRGGRRGERSERGDGRTERNDRTERTDKSDARNGERPEGRPSRHNRGERPERQRQEPRLDESGQHDVSTQAAETTDNAQGDRPARQGRERGDGRRPRSRRGERSAPSTGEGTTPSEEAIHATELEHPATMEQRLDNAQHESSQAERGNERRERRGRERPGRERQARAGQSDDTGNLHASESSHLPASSTAPVLAAAKTMPKVGAFALPIDQLHQVAQSSGLEWINSNPERVALIQAAIAAEPRPVHVPRERPAPVVLDEGPLILVETKRNLSQIQMPFETSDSQA